MYFKIAVICSLGIVFYLLVNMQVVEGAKYKKEADDNRIYVEPIIAPRGIIYDRNNVPLVYNQDVFSVVLNTNIFDPTTEKSTLSTLANLLAVNPKDLEKTYDSG